MQTLVMRKLLLVTDIGSDVDDVLCLLVLAEMQKMGQVSVIGIVTTGGNTQTRAMIARRWSSAVSLVDKEFIVDGEPDSRPDLEIAGTFLLHACVKEEDKYSYTRTHKCTLPLPQHAGFFPDEHPPLNKTKQERRSSSEFIFNLLREHAPEDVTLIIIGALTPIAAALSLATTEGEDEKAKEKEGGSTTRSNLELLRSLHCLAIQGQAVMNNKSTTVKDGGEKAGGGGELPELMPDIVNAFNLRDDAAAAKMVFSQLSTFVPFVLLGKHAAYKVPIHQRDLARLEHACPQAHLKRTVRKMLWSFSKENAQFFASVYPHAAVLLAPREASANGEATRAPLEGGGGGGDGAVHEGGSWFELVDPCCYTYDALLAVYLGLPHLFKAQNVGRHELVGNDEANPSVVCQEEVHLPQCLSVVVRLFCSARDARARAHTHTHTH